MIRVPGTTVFKYELYYWPLIIAFIENSGQQRGELLVGDDGAYELDAAEAVDDVGEDCVGDGGDVDIVVHLQTF